MSGWKIWFMKIVFILFSVLLFTASCKKDRHHRLRYYEVGINASPADWRDTAFIVATSDPELIDSINAQLGKAVQERQILFGKLARGSGGYNKNANHVFGWHFKEDEWALVDVSAEIYDGRPYSDVDLNPGYWQDTLNSFSPWGSYIKKEILRN
jgi:hypothetical protein